MTEPASQPDRQRRRLVLLICSMSLLVVGLDATIVNVALPAIRDSLGASLAGLQWTIDGYTLVIGSLLIVSGSTADRLGRRRIFQLGLGIFSLGSLLCALAPSTAVLVGARVVQAIGGSMLTPVALSIVRNVFTDPTERARAIGVFSSMFGVSLALGPVLGGALVDTLGWRSVFAVAVPVCVVAMVLAQRYVPESRADRPRAIDPVAQLLIIVGLASLAFGLIEGPVRGWGSLEIVSVLALSAVAFCALVPYELRRREPLIEFRFFRSVPFAGAAATAVSAFFAFGGFLFLNTLYLQSVRGLSPLDAGLYLLPMALMVIVSAQLSGRLVGSRGPRISLVMASLTFIVALAMLTRLEPDTSATYLLATYALFGAGFGFVNPPIANAAVSGMPPSQAGVAAAIASTSRQVGLTLGVAVVGALAGSGAALTSGTGSEFIADALPVWWTLLAASVIMLVLAVASTTRRAQLTARRTVEELVEAELASAVA